MEKSNLFVDGLFVNRRENAPDFVIASLSFNQKFIDYLKANSNMKGYCNVDVLKSKDGKLYAKLNDWKPEEKFVRTPEGKLNVEERLDEIKEEQDSIKVENIPFNQNLSKL